MENSGYNTRTPEINLDRVKRLTMSKIQREKKRHVFSFKSRFSKAACAVVAAFVITTGSVAYAMKAEDIKIIISYITGIQQAKVLTVGKMISNKDYQLKVHEIVTDSSLGYIVISVEALSESSKESFESYRYSSYETQIVGRAIGITELHEYKEPYIRYYKIGLSGRSKLNKYDNDGILQFSLRGIDTPIEVSLSPTIDRIDMDITEDTTNGYQYQFKKLYLSELGLSFEAIDTKTNVMEYDYKIELLFNDGTKELLLQKKNEVSDHGNLLGGWSGNSGPDTNGNYYADTFISFSKNIPIHTINKVIINDIEFDIDRLQETDYN